jgi:FtsP/CotA-like multicopper oxidase with cupredoxin domain
VLIDRRSLLKLAGLYPFAAALLSRAWGAVPEPEADYTLRIAPGLVELAPDHIVSTPLYNAQFPGPLLRFKEAQPLTVDVFNDTDTPELVHWHRQTIPSEVDGASEAVRAAAWYAAARLHAKSAGFRFYHTHVVAGGDLNRGTYTG